MTETNVSIPCLKCGTEKTTENSTRDKNRPDGRNAYCKVCAKEKQLLTYAKHRDSHLERRKADYRAKKDQYKMRASEWAAANKQKRQEIMKKYLKNNPENRAETNKKHRLANPGIYPAHYKMRQTRKRRALSSWANLDAIEALYVECARISKETGIKHHVDHYFPLKSDVVCGLHNEFNLRIVPATVNLSKGNSFPEDKQ